MYTYMKALVFALGLALLSTLATVAYAQEEESESLELTVLESEEFGEYVADDSGLALYLYTEDEDGVSNCEDACAENWPPLLVEDADALSAGDDIDADLLGTAEREDGSLQVTYAEQPLYTSRHDEEGTTRGQKIGRGVFQLVSPEGSGITEALEKEQVEVDEETFETLMADGDRGYAANCGVCHGPEGRGGVGPRLADNSIVGNTNFLVDRILDGFPDHGMPPFRDVLDDHEIAAISTFIRNSFDNDYGAVTEEEVEERR